MALIAEHILHTVKIAYLIVGRDSRVAGAGGAIHVLGAGENVLDRLVFELIPELIGSEADLAGVRCGMQDGFRLEQINRTARGDGDGAEGGTRYLTVMVLPVAGGPATGDVLVVVADNTEQGRYAQALMQHRNELRLARRELAQANAQLDFLLRRYVPVEVADALLERRIPPQPGGELREVTVLFADLRGYSQAAGRLSPPATMELVNQYLNVAAEAIAGAGGTITQFMGDAVMALFNAPNDQSDHALRAVRAGLAVQAATRAHHSKAASDLPVVHFGVGIHTGPAVVGNTGASWRYDYSAIGDTTNVAYGLCRAARAREVLIGPLTCKLLAGQAAVTPLAPMLFKGKAEAMPVFRVEGPGGEPGWDGGVYTERGLLVP